MKTGIKVTGLLFVCIGLGYFLLLFKGLVSRHLAAGIPQIVLAYLALHGGYGLMRLKELGRKLLLVLLWLYLGFIGVSGLIVLFDLLSLIDTSSWFSYSYQAGHSLLTVGIWGIWLLLLGGAIWFLSSERVKAVLLSRDKRA